MVEWVFVVFGTIYARDIGKGKRRDAFPRVAAISFRVTDRGVLLNRGPDGFANVVTSKTPWPGVKSHFRRGMIASREPLYNLHSTFGLVTLLRELSRSLARICRAHFAPEVLLLTKARRPNRVTERLMRP